MSKLVLLFFFCLCLIPCRFEEDPFQSTPVPGNPLFSDPVQEQELVVQSSEPEINKDANENERTNTNTQNQRVKDEKRQEKKERINEKMNERQAMAIQEKVERERKERENADRLRVEQMKIEKRAKRGPPPVSRPPTGSARKTPMKIEKIVVENEGMNDEEDNNEETPNLPEEKTLKTTESSPENIETTPQVSHDHHHHHDDYPEPSENHQESLEKNAKTSENSQETSENRLETSENKPETSENNPKTPLIESPPSQKKSQKAKDSSSPSSLFEAYYLIPAHQVLVDIEAFFLSISPKYQECKQDQACFSILSITISLIILIKTTQWLNFLFRRKKGNSLVPKEETFYKELPHKDLQSVLNELQTIKEKLGSSSNDLSSQNPAFSSQNQAFSSQISLEKLEISLENQQKKINELQENIAKTNALNTRFHKALLDSQREIVCDLAFLRQAVKKTPLEKAFPTRSEILEATASEKGFPSLKPEKRGIKPNEEEIKGDHEKDKEKAQNEGFIREKEPNNHKKQAQNAHNEPKDVQIPTKTSQISNKTSKPPQISNKDAQNSNPDAQIPPKDPQIPPKDQKHPTKDPSSSPKDTQIPHKDPSPPLEDPQDPPEKAPVMPNLQPGGVFPQPRPFNPGNRGVPPSFAPKKQPVRGPNPFQAKKEDPNVGV